MHCHLTNYRLIVHRCTAFIILLLSVAATELSAQKNNELASPNGDIQFTFNLTNQKATYSIAYKKKWIVKESALGLSFANGTFNEHLKASKPIYREAEEVYELVVGKTKTVKERYNEIIIPLEQTINRIHVNLIVRAFNDGIAFQYEFLSIPNHNTFELTEEATAFNLTENPRALAMYLPNFTTSHEGFYTKAALSEIKEGELMAVPTLFEFPNHIYLAITEAALLDYAGMYLMKEKGILRSKLSPLPNQPSIKVKGTLPHKSSWRVLMISDRLGALIESNLITNLNEPCRLKDVSWIRPGKTTFPWWNGNVVSDTLNAPGNNFVTQQYYIDFCARNGLEYHSVVEYGLHQWYQDDGIGFQPGHHADVTKPVPGLDMKQVCDYAKSKGVGVRVWVQWAALYPKLDSAFAQFERWGLSGMMIDFMDRDDQEMVNIQTEMLEKAARHHLHIQFHGAYKPTGLHHLPQ
jgi:alpha-glucosidase